MKCPRCDADITGKRKCSKCGLNFADSQEEIEVEYKDFKTSELLEIRHKKQVALEQEEIKTLRGHQEEETLKRESPGEALCKRDKKPFSFLAAMALIILMLIAGVFLFFRYVIMR